MNSIRVNDVAESVCHNLEKAQDNKDQGAALELLRNEVKKDTSAMDLQQAKEYMAELTEELQESKQLPVLSLAYADQFGTDVSRTDLREELRSVNRSLTFGENDKLLDKVILRSLLDNYDGGVVLIEAVDEETDYDSTISRADIEAKLAEYRGSAKPVCK